MSKKEHTWNVMPKIPSRQPNIVTDKYTGKSLVPKSLLHWKHGPISGLLLASAWLGRCAVILNI